MGRIANVSRIATVTLAISVWNSAAMSFSTNTRRKKSNASRVHPRKLAATTCFCSLVHPDKTLVIIAPSQSRRVAPLIHALLRRDRRHLVGERLQVHGPIVEPNTAVVVKP